MDKEGFRTLVDRFILGTITPAEKQQFLSLIEVPPYREELESILKEAMVTDRYDMSLDPQYTEIFIQKLNGEINSAPHQRSFSIHYTNIFKRTWFRIAAAVLMVFCAAAYFYYQGNKKQNNVAIAPPASATPVNDALPGGDKAILTLADGSVITLDNANNGELAKQGGVEVMKLANGQLSYVVKSTPAVTNTEVTYNTLETPRGGQYQILLPDGTKVWLNAISSIRFPTVFTGPERDVSVTGEAYFEVAHDKSKPFKVKTRETEIEVLGTNFNVNAYEDEQSIKTTLIEGSVKVSRLLTPSAAASAEEGRVSRVLVPGQQADQNLNIKQNIDVQQVIAWKNGLFKFDRATIQEVTRQLSRWYNVDIIYEKEIPDIKFAGEMQRSLNLSEVLEILEKMGVTFKIEGKKLLIKSTK